VTSSSPELHGVPKSCLAHRMCWRPSWTVGLDHTVISGHQCMTVKAREVCVPQWVQCSPGLHREFKAAQGMYAFKDNLGLTLSSRPTWLPEGWRRAWVAQCFEGWPGPHSVFKAILIKSVKQLFQSLPWLYAETLSSTLSRRHLFLSPDLQNPTKLLFLK
jgi:hypothetical protein